MPRWRCCLTLNPLLLSPCPHPCYHISGHRYTRSKHLQMAPSFCPTRLWGSIRAGSLGTPTFQWSSGSAGSLECWIQSPNQASLSSSPWGHQAAKDCGTHQSSISLLLDKLVSFKVIHIKGQHLPSHNNDANTTYHFSLPHSPREAI